MRANADENPVDNRNGQNDNEDRENPLSDNRKTTMFNTIVKKFDDYTKRHVANGESLDEISKELASDAPNLRHDIIGQLEALNRSLNNVERTPEEKRYFVEHHSDRKNLTDAQVEEEYKLFQNVVKEMADYAGVLFREIALNYRANRGQSISLVD